MARAKTRLTPRERQEIAERIARRALRRGELVPFMAYQTLGPVRINQIRRELGLIAVVVEGRDRPLMVIGS